MALIQEEIHNDILDTTIEVLEQEDKEMVEKWFIVSLRVDGWERCTPKQLQELGKWLIVNGERIGKEYRSDGSKKE